MPASFGRPRRARQVHTLRRQADRERRLRRQDQDLGPQGRPRAAILGLVPLHSDPK